MPNLGCPSSPTLALQGVARSPVAHCSWQLLPPIFAVQAMLPVGRLLSIPPQLALGQPRLKAFLLQQPIQQVLVPQLVQLQLVRAQE